MKKKIVINAFTLMLLLLVSPLWAAPMLSIDSATGLEGELVTVGVNYTADSPAITGGNPVVVKFRIHFTPSLVEAGTPLSGLSLAGDHVPYAKVDNVAGTIDVIIVPPANKIALSSGQILQLPFRLKSVGANPVNDEARSPLSFSLLEMSNDNPIAVAVPANGVLIIKDPRTYNPNGINKTLSDGFNTTTLDETQWLKLNPLGEGSIRLNGNQLILNVSAGEHYFGSSNNTVRVMQPIIDEDFAIEVKFDSLPTQRFQVQGILVEQDINTSLRFEVYSDGSQLKLYVGNYRNGGSTSLYNKRLIGAAIPLYFRVERVAQLWTFSTSSDGASWQLVTQFSHGLMANEIGVYVGNTR